MHFMQNKHKGRLGVPGLIRLAKKMSQTGLIISADNRLLQPAYPIVNKGVAVDRSRVAGR